MSQARATGPRTESPRLRYRAPAEMHLEVVVGERMTARGTFTAIRGPVSEGRSRTVLIWLIGKFIRRNADGHATLNRGPRVRCSCYGRREINR